MATKNTATQGKPRRTLVKQNDVPRFPITDALRIPQAIADHYASKPTTPLNVAAALDMRPTSSRFRMLCGAATAYGLTSGGYNANEIEITDLGRRIVRPTDEGEDDLAAKREAFLSPRIIGDFLRKYDNSPLPREDIAINVLIPWVFRVIARRTPYRSWWMVLSLLAYYG